MTTREPGAGCRRDLAVVLARGLALRMGRPKGLIALEGFPGTFVARICALYSGWAETVVVVGPQQGPAYADALAGDPSVAVLEAAPGEGTARTLHLGWRENRDRATHIWAHPVDMPLVSPETVMSLRERSCAHPDRIIRPEAGGKPGHPVVMPREFLQWLGGSATLLAGAVLDALPAAPCEVMAVPSRDTGTVTDFDTPEDLPPGSGKVEGP